MKRMKRLLLRRTVLLAFIGTFLITGCAGTTVKYQLNNPGFQKENVPPRTLRVGVFSNGTYSQEDIVQLINKASSILDKQLGIRLEVVSYQPIKWEEQKCNLMLDKLHDSTLNVPDNIDIAVAFASHKLLRKFTLWNGVIDDSYRRYIILKKSTAVFIHEIGHCFIFSHNHSSNGVMRSIPFTTYFSPEDREEILKNKWRDFNVKPDLNESGKINLLKEDRE